MKRYAIKEIFTTLQGEGSLAGTPALFVRFSGCNLWSGHDKDRLRDAGRNDAACPLWCDTDFISDPKRLTAKECIEHMEVTAQLAGLKWESFVPLIVLTGGEPLLQLDAQILSWMREAFPDTVFAIETNGLTEPKFLLHEYVNHVCVSPKGGPERLKIRSGAELKVVFPTYCPDDYEIIADRFSRCYVSPEAFTSERGVSVIRKDNVQRAVQYCLDNPRWRLSQQTHKELGLP